MARPVTVGLDGSPESLAAAGWAAHEARSRDAPLRLVNAWPVLDQKELTPGREAAWQYWAERALSSARAELDAAHPDMAILTDQIPGMPAPVLLAEAERAQLLVVGSRSIGAVAGFFLGSVGLELAARSVTPVVLVRADGREERHGDVVAGVEPGEPCDDILEFAFDAAARRGGVLRAVYANRVPAIRGDAPWVVDVGLCDAREEAEHSLGEVLAPWRDKFPEVRVFEEVASDSPARRLVGAAAGTALMVVGRGPRRVGFGPRLGPVAQAVAHHAACPVAVVPQR
ncbi:universal stress protein [Streptomyces malaysiensis]|uniref:UspA domain-containing protein n=1 Tax=Streptomyces malaysiensis TaxID=92644 RepID=A0A7X5XBL9_STRMQ|nr:universal stress protein [Streptomyces malaysiensis]NIY70242.1 UspA domain-containing protein [Streptomyces malaysiensis]